VGFFLFSKKRLVYDNKEQPYGCNFRSKPIHTSIIVINAGDETMSMKYIRTYKVIYSDTVLPVDTTLAKAGKGRGQMCKTLFDNGILLFPSYVSNDSSHYAYDGPKERIASNLKKVSLYKVTPSGQMRTKFEKVSEGHIHRTHETLLGDLIQEKAFGKGSFGVKVEDISVKEEYWPQKEGNTVRLKDLSFLGDEIPHHMNCDELVLTPAELEGETIVIQCKLESSKEYGSKNKLKNGLAFTITWDSKSIQRKDSIEQWLVQYPLSIIAHFQAKYEKVIAENGDQEIYTNEFFENVEIDCHFDAISESRSECTPDIIKQVRDAKNAKKMELNQ